MVARHLIESVKAIPIDKVLSALGIPFDPSRPYHIKCPFPAHAATGKTPSLKVYVKYNRFVCFGCGVKGSTIDLVAHTKEITPQEAVRFLAEEFGLEFDNSCPSLDYFRSLAERANQDRSAVLSSSMQTEVEKKISSLYHAERARIKADPNFDPEDLAMLDSYAEGMWEESDRIREDEGSPEEFMEWAVRHEKALTPRD